MRRSKSYNAKKICDDEGDDDLEQMRMKQLSGMKICCSTLITTRDYAMKAKRLRMINVLTSGFANSDVVLSMFSLLKYSSSLDGLVISFLKTK